MGTTLFLVKLNFLKPYWQWCWTNLYLLPSPN